MGDAGTSYGLDNLRLTGRCLALFAAVCLVGAILARLTGEEVSVDGEQWRTHAEAVVVLVVLGVVSALSAALVAWEVRGRGRALTRQASRSSSPLSTS